MILLFGNAIVLMNRFGENLCDVINEAENAPAESMEKLKNAVDYHNKLLNLFNEIIRIYKTPLLVNILAQTMNIGMVTYIVSVSILSIL